MKKLFIGIAHTSPPCRLIAVALIIYAMELLFPGQLLVPFIAGAIVFVALALAFQALFWYTQMKHQRPGIGFKEWINFADGGIKK